MAAAYRRTGELYKSCLDLWRRRDRSPLEWRVWSLFVGECLYDDRVKVRFDVGYAVQRVNIRNRPANTSGGVVEVSAG